LVLFACSEALNLSLIAIAFKFFDFSKELEDECGDGERKFFLKIEAAAVDIVFAFLYALDYPKC